MRLLMRLFMKVNQTKKKLCGTFFKRMEQPHIN